jgi:hypothetical protein
MSSHQTAPTSGEQELQDIDHIGSGCRGLRTHFKAVESGTRGRDGVQITWVSFNWRHSEFDGPIEMVGHESRYPLVMLVMLRPIEYSGGMVTSFGECVVGAT